MKKYFLTATILLFCCNIQCAFSQTTGILKNLKGTWAVDLNSTISNISGEEKLRYDNMPEAAQQSVKNAFDGRTYLFTKDNQVIIKYMFKNSPRQTSGQWTYEQSNSTLKITAEQRSKEYIVEWQTSDRIRLADKDTSAQNKLTVKSIYLNRIN